MKKSKMRLSLAALLFIGCEIQHKNVNSSAVITMNEGPTLTQLIDSLKVDSVKYRSEIDSLLLFRSNDSAMNPYLDQCYWEYHVRTINIKPVYDKRGFSSTEADIKAEWLFEHKTVDCGNFEKKLAEFNGVTFLDSTCNMCLLLRLDPFDCPIQYVTLDKFGDLIFTESYARGGLLGFPRIKQKYHLDYLDEKEIEALLEKLSGVPSENHEIGLDGMMIDVGFVLKGRVYKINRWQDPQEMQGLWRFIERKLKVKIPKCDN